VYLEAQYFVRDGEMRRRGSDGSEKSCAGPIERGATRYQRVTARGYFRLYSNLEVISFWRRGGSSSDRCATPDSTELIYVLASGGKYARSSEVRLGNGLLVRCRNHPERPSTAAGGNVCEECWCAELTELAAIEAAKRLQNA